MSHHSQESVSTFYLSTICRLPSFSLLVSSTPTVLSEDIERESQKVRSMYVSGTNYNSRPEGDESPIESRIKVDESANEDTFQT